jgi:hypothetical protein
MANENVLPVESVIEAGAEAAATRRLVRALRAAALTGGTHNPALFDAAVLEHRQAKRRAAQALASWAGARRERTPEHYYRQRAA